MKLPQWEESGRVRTEDGRRGQGSMDSGSRLSVRHQRFRQWVRGLLIEERPTERGAWQSPEKSSVGVCASLRCSICNLRVICLSTWRPRPPWVQCFRHPLVICSIDEVSMNSAWVGKIENSLDWLVPGDSSVICLALEPVLRLDLRPGNPEVAARNVTLCSIFCWPRPARALLSGWHARLCVRGIGRFLSHSVALSRLVLMIDTLRTCKRGHKSLCRLATVAMRFQSLCVNVVCQWQWSCGGLVRAPNRVELGFLGAVKSTPFIWGWRFVCS